jgi:membrane protease YdiL (CAAX protease family)
MVGSFHVMRPERRAATWIGLSLALGAPIVLALALGSARRTGGDVSFVRTIVVDWVFAILLLAIVRFGERLSLSSIGLRRVSVGDVLWGVGGFVLGGLVFAVTTPLVQLFGLGDTSQGIARLAQSSMGLRVAIVLTAGITEEILFRGYPIERLYTLTGRLPLAGLISYVVFVLLHLAFWGVGGTIQIGAWALIVTWLYVRRRSLAACMIMHILNDGYAFILLPYFFGQYF